MIHLRDYFTLVQFMMNAPIIDRASLAWSKNMT